MPRPYLANLPLLQSFHQRTQLNSIIKVGFEVIHCVAAAVELQVDPVHEGVLLNGNPLVTVSASHRQPPPFLRSGLLADEVHFSRHVCLCLCVSPTCSGVPTTLTLTSPPCCGEAGFKYAGFDNSGNSNSVQGLLCRPAPCRCT